MTNGGSQSEQAFRHSQVRVGPVSIHVVECGPSEAQAILFLHGWPQNWRAFEALMREAGKTARAVAMDLPGVGESRGALLDARKATIAECVNRVAHALDLRSMVLVGHDIGGQVAFSYLTQFAQTVSGVVIMDVVIPGIPPWESVIGNPSLWHFAFHNVQNLPEKLLAGRQGPYFDFFFDAIAKHPDAIRPEARRSYSAAYADPRSLKTGFDWYRAFEDDARDNAAFAASKRRISTPTLIIRGADERGQIGEYAAGLQAAGLESIITRVIPDCGHFSPEESPVQVWDAIWALLLPV